MCGIRSMSGRYASYWNAFLFNFFFLQDISPFCGTPSVTSGDVCPGFQKQGGSLACMFSSPVCTGFLRFTSGATPTDPLSFLIHVLKKSYV